jgi:hypothetical protein
MFLFDEILIKYRCIKIIIIIIKTSIFLNKKPFLCLKQLNLRICFFQVLIIILLGSIFKLKYFSSFN